MKKAIITVLSTVMICIVSTVSVFAEVGQMGFFGGINEGTRLPKTTETILLQAGSIKKPTTVETLYKEVVFLSGVPVETEGILTVKTSGGIKENTDFGTYKVNYQVKPNTDITEGEASLTRSIEFTVNYRIKDSQIVKDYTIASWTETIETPEGIYTLDRNRSYFDISILEDKTPGVTYYKGDVSQKAVYLSGEDSNTTLEIDGSFYGYDCAWSNTETHRLNGRVYTDEWQMEYQVRPNVSVNKTLQYSANEPMAMSFEGNYRELMTNKSGLQYDIFVQPVEFYDIEKTGNTSISSRNSFEQLITADTAYLKGHPAEADIAKLFSMGILEGDPKHYSPSQSITRSQYVTMLTKAIKLPIEEQQTKTTSRKAPVITYVFPDVSSEREDYPYIMAANKSGLAVGRGNGYFYADYSLQREEAIVILVRTLGLSTLGLDPSPVTAFADDSEISAWAKRDLNAAYKLGLISPDENGNINPKVIVSKAEAAALVNQLIDYMRSGLQTDYENIVNYAD